MNAKTLLLSATLALATGGAFAGELYTPAQYDDSGSSAATRAQVKQEVLRERARGGLEHNDVDVPAPVATPFGRTRADVKAEVLAARKTGGLEHNDVDVPAIATGSQLSRDAVKQEAVAARAQSRNAPGRNTIAY